MNRQRRFFLLMGASALIASACTRVTQSHNQSILSASKAVKGVEHAFGETKVPVNPTRVIAWGYTIIEAVLAHGVRPIGAPKGFNDGVPHLSLEGPPIAEVGTLGQPNLAGQ